MAWAVVRCPSCLGDSQVEAGALGLTVRCPRCDATFTAVGAAELTARAPRNPTLTAPEPRPKRSRRRRRERDRRPEPTRPKPETEHDHDPHRHAAEALPASVLIGLALLPFAIPILWLIAPAVTGIAPAMSIATPSALAVATSILCLAVIYTVDWTAATRIKGVLMLVSLAYFGAVSLYFLKQQLVEKFKNFTGKEEVEWRDFKGESYRVKMPAMQEEAEPVRPPLQSIKLKCHTAGYDRRLFGRFEYVVGSYRFAEKDKVALSDDWFEQIAKEIVKESGGILWDQTLRKIRPPDSDKLLGRELEIRFRNKGVSRIVRFYVVHGSLYYLSVEGMGMNVHDPHARYFFESLVLEPAVGAAPR